MVKQIVLIVGLSVAAIFFQEQLSNLLDGMIYMHNYIARGLELVFSSGRIGRLVQDVIALLIIPCIAGGVGAFSYWIAKRKMLPNTMLVIWIIWLVLLTTMLAQTGMSPVPTT